ncbi:phage major capsid protein [Flavobacterium sp. CSZ]|uniref:phage major capsid protein n=1 Tax=Flavobacterium sp. CSZ TaxID=2783791 RepID=UPI00188AA6D5|nr:phage major capsid protein [Flavobacterium sp. CSZ]MBF4484426.1 phage major capsid protein [Flavobacterium sp. CSZ]
MKKSAELKQKRAQKIEAQKTLRAKSVTEKRDMNETETAEFRTLQTDIETLNGQIADEVAFEDNLRSLEGSEGVGFEENEHNPQQRTAPKPFSINSAIRSLMNGTALVGEELEAHKRATEVAKRAGVGVNPNGLMVPLFDSRSVETRADGQTVTQDAGGYGATTVATEVGAPIDYLRPQPVLESLGAVFLTGLQGNLSFPKNNGGISAVWKGEVETVDPTKDAWGEVEMTPKRLTVRVPISLQNLMQSSFDMEQYTMKTIRDVIANAIDKAGINGSGTGEPLGILNASGTNSLAMGTNGLAPTWGAMVGLETPVFVENANSAKMNYLSNPKVRGKLKVTPKESGQATYLMAEDGTVNGYPFAVSNHVPSNLTKGSSTAVASAAIFGDFSQLVIGQWGFMDLTVDDKSRKKDGYIEIIANVFVDVLVKQPKAFTVVKDLLTA